MEYIHIKNLDKYNPGYSDRTLIWCKIYFTMLNTNYEFDELDDIDKWRFIALVMLELQRKKPIPNDVKWLRKKISNHKKPILLTLKMLHNFIEYVTEEGCIVAQKSDDISKNPVTQNRIDKNRIDKDKKQEPSAVSQALKKIEKTGFNIYALINKAKIQTGQPKDWQFPEEVLLGVCKAYERDKANIRSPWPWFIKVLNEESALWHAQQNINRNKDKRAGYIPSLKELFR